MIQALGLLRNCSTECLASLNQNHIPCAMKSLLLRLLRAIVSSGTWVFYCSRIWSLKGSLKGQLIPQDALLINMVYISRRLFSHCKCLMQSPGKLGRELRMPPGLETRSIALGTGSLPRHCGLVTGGGWWRCHACSDHLPKGTLSGYLCPHRCCGAVFGWVEHVENLGQDFGWDCMIVDDSRTARTSCGWPEHWSYVLRIRWCTRGRDMGVQKKEWWDPGAIQVVWQDPSWCGWWKSLCTCTNTILMWSQHAKAPPSA